MFKNILVPTDGSDHAEKAVDLAADLAARYQAHITLMYCYNKDDAREIRKAARSEHLIGEGPGRRRNGRGSQSLDVVTDATIYSRVGQMVMQHANSTLREKGIRDFDTLVATGDPARQILRQARDQHADMIVMGTSAPSDLKALLTGSVSHRVNQEADCTCVTVK